MREKKNETCCVVLFELACREKMMIFECILPFRSVKVILKCGSFEKVEENINVHVAIVEQNAKGGDVTLF